MALDTTQLEGELASFAGDPAFLLAEIFPDQRFPNVVVALDGTVLATWGTTEVGVRRSEDGGLTWRPAIPIGPGIHAGGATVDEGTGNVLVFVHSEHPPKDRSLATRTMYRSMDAGCTWVAEDATYGEDRTGHVPSLHMAECGITLRHGEHAGRLLRPARVYASPQGLTHPDPGLWTSSPALSTVQVVFYYAPIPTGARQKPMPGRQNILEMAFVFPILRGRHELAKPRLPIGFPDLQ